MLERAVLLVGLAIITVAVIVAWRAWWERRLDRLRSTDHRPLWSSLGEQPDGRPALVVFSAPGCIACRTAQHPAVEAVASEFGKSLRVLNVDIAERPAVGRAFNVLTAPSTVVLDSRGRIGSFNQGFAAAERLAAQVSALGVSPVSAR